MWQGMPGVENNLWSTASKQTGTTDLKLWEVGFCQLLEERGRGPYAPDGAAWDDWPCEALSRGPTMPDSWSRKLLDDCDVLSRWVFGNLLYSNKKLLYHLPFGECLKLVPRSRSETSMEWKFVRELIPGSSRRVVGDWAGTLGRKPAGHICEHITAVGTGLHASGSVRDEVTVTRSCLPKSQENGIFSLQPVLEEVLLQKGHYR